MLNVIYLVLVVTSGQGVSIERIPQANIKQCQINAKSMSDVKYKSAGGYNVSYRAHCVVGVK